MGHIIVFEQKNFMMQRIKKVLNFEHYQLHEAQNYLQLEHFLAHDLIQIEMIIAELDFDKQQEIEMISSYLAKYPETKLIIFTSDMSRKAFLDSIKVGAKDYIIDTVTDEDIRSRVEQHLLENIASMIPTHLILNLNKYISGEMIKANKGNYQLTIAFTTILNEKGLHIAKHDTANIGNFFSNAYWDTDSIVIYGFNHMLSFFPFCNRGMIETVEKKLQHMFAQFKSINLHLAKCELHNTYVTFPDEGLTVEDILRIVRKKIQNGAK